MSGEVSSDSRLRVVVGAGMPQEIPEEAALRQSGSIRDALQQLLNEKAIHDTQGSLATMLGKERVVVEVSDPDGNEKEIPLGPNDEWERILRGHKEGKVQEIGVAESHRGGTQ